MLPTSPPTVFRRVVLTNPHQVAKLVASFNRLPLAVMAQRSECGPRSVYVPDLRATAPAATLHEIAFSKDSRSKPNVIAVVPSCTGIAVRAHHTEQPTLKADAGFANLVTTILTAHH
jgi:hypothetical protein